MKLSSIILVLCFVIGSSSVSVWKTNYQNISTSDRLLSFVNKRRISRDLQLVEDDDKAFKKTAMTVLSNIFADRRINTIKAIGKRKGRQTTVMKTNPFVTVFVDIIMNYIQPMVDRSGVRFSSMVRPILVYISSVAFNTGIGVVKSLFIPNNQTEELKFINSTEVSDRNMPHVIYPVMIPGYGSYMLISDFGAYGILENTSIPNMNPTKGTTLSPLQTPGTTVSTTEKTTGSTSRDSSSSSSSSEEKTTKEPSKEMTTTTKKDDEIDSLKIPDKESSSSSDNTDSKNDDDEKEKDEDDEDESKEDDDDDNKIKSSKSNSKQKDEPDEVTESEEALWSKNIDEIVSDSLKQIIGNKTTITPKRKKILLSIINRLEFEILNL